MAEDISYYADKLHWGKLLNELMDALRPDKSTHLDAPPHATVLARGLALFLLVSSFLVIFFVGTFPFDFTFGRDAWKFDFDWRWHQHDPNYTDRSQNIALFVPFGFALAGMVRRKRWSWATRIAVGTIGGALFTSAIESSQMFVSFRDPSLMDLWCNTLGAAIGAVLYVLFGDPLLRAATQCLLLLRPLANPWIMAIVLLLYSLIQLIGPLLIRNPGDMSVWDTDLPLTVGNEVTGERSWSGTVSEIALADRAIDPGEAVRIWQGESPEKMLGDSLLAHYIPRGAAPYADRTGHLPPLNWAGSATTTQPDQSPPILPKQWLTTSVPVTFASERIAKSSELTLATWVTPYTLNQRGPARLVSISRDTSSRNVQLGQEFEDLSVRVRNAVRVMPDMRVHNVFVENQPRHIVVTAKGPRIIVYIDGQERGTVQVTPEAKMIWRLYPRQGFFMRMERYGFRSYGLIYRLMIFVPFSALLGATLILSNLQPSTKRVIAILAVSVMAIALELILISLGGLFRFEDLVLSLMIGCGTLWLLAMTRRRRRAPAQVLT